MQQAETSRAEVADGERSVRTAATAAVDSHSLQLEHVSRDPPRPGVCEQRGRIYAGPDGKGVYLRPFHMQDTSFSAG